MRWARVRARDVGGQLGRASCARKRAAPFREPPRGAADRPPGGRQLTQDILSLARDPVEVVEVRQRLVEALRAEHDLERLDVALLVQGTQPLGYVLLRDARASLRDPQLMAQAQPLQAKRMLLVAQRRRAASARRRAAGRVSRGSAPPRAISPRLQHLSRAATTCAATDLRRRPTVRSTPPGRRRRTTPTAVAACVPALARGGTVPQSRSRGTALRAEMNKFRRIFPAGHVDAYPNRLLTCPLVTYRPHPVRPSRPLLGGCHS